jgi:ceramide glucosyltransferase
MRGETVSLAATAAGVSLSVHALSCALAWRRCAASAAKPPFAGKPPPVTIVQPHRGVEPFSQETLASIFRLDYPDYEIVFCVASEADPIVPLLRRHIAANPERPARILVGDNPISGNPKLNNVVKGWKAARHDWIALADSNVLMPADYLTRLMARWRSDTGLVASPPIGAAPVGFAAHLECAFLNAYQARWQYAAEAAGFGFAQGKTMLWRRRLLEEAGGIEALAAEIAEDAAATKIVRRAGLAAHLVDRPFPQPLGRRNLRDVWQRQVRWARLRRATFAPYFLPELLTTSLVPILAAALAAPAFEAPAMTAAALAAALWYGAEAALAAAAGWPLGPWTIPAAIARDLALPWLWVEGIASDRFEWRGAALTVAEIASPDPKPSI